ncbi:MAG: hypothetical protein IPM42_04400 [Saprospiraceae bacterium]|nr:hypothetical protein [Saprospiraceae bacterium]
MEHKTKRDLALINLIADFETKYEQGEIGYMQEKIYLQLIEYYEDEYLLDKALEVVNIALEQYQYRSEFYIIKARLLLCSNKIDEGIILLDQAEAIAPFEREITVLRARALAMKKDFHTALSILSDFKAVSTKTDMVDILIAESYVYEYMKNYDVMYDCLAKAVIMDTKNEEAMERIWISAELSRRYDDSVKLHLEIIERDPYNYQAWYNLGHGYNCIWEYEKAIDALEYSFIINPDFESGYLDCADTCVQIRDFSKALQIYIDANSRFGPNNELMVNIADCFINLNKINTAKQWLLKSIKLDGFNDEAYYLLGQCYAKEQVWYNAINAYHKAIQLENRREEYYLGLAKAYLAVEDYNKATLNFQMATQTGPEETTYWREYVTFMIKLGLYDEAMQILDEAEDHTYGADLIYCRAITHYFIKEKIQCMELLEEALMEDFAQHSIIFEMAPELKLDKEINAMIRYFAEESSELI